MSDQTPPPDGTEGSGSVPTPPPYEPPATPPTPPPPPVPPAPPGGAAPPPPPPPPPAAAGGSGVEIGPAWSWSISKFGKYAGMLIGLAAVVFALRLIQTLVQNAIFNNLNRCDIDTNAGQINCGISIGASITLSVVMALIFGILIALATVGIYRAALKMTRGEAPSFDNMLSTENLGPYVVVAIVYFVLSLVGLALCFIPGIIVIFLFQFAPFYALDKGAGVGEALGASYRGVTQNIGPVILLALINIVIAILSGLLWGLPTLVLLPFAALITAHVYRQINREPVAP